MPVSASEKVKLRASIMQDLGVEAVGKDISFKLTTPFKVDDKLTLSEGTKVVVHVYHVKSERRFHKSGFFKCVLLNYTLEGSNTPVNLVDKNIYFVCRRYDKIDPYDATVTSVGVTASTIAGIFLPGVDTVYYFLKGATQDTEDANWFKAGVHNAYDNSILWFFEKGKPINLQPGDNVVLTSFSHKKEKIKYDSIDIKSRCEKSQKEEPIDIDDVDMSKFNTKKIK